MVDVLTKIIIHKPIDLVADYAANSDNAPEWYVNIQSVYWKTSKGYLSKWDKHVKEILIPDL